MQKITLSSTSTIVPVTLLVQYYFSVAVLSITVVPSASTWYLYCTWLSKLVVSTKQDFAFRQQELNSSHLPVQKITVSGTSTIVPVTWLVQYYFSVAVLSNSTKCKFLVLVLYLVIKTCRKHKARFRIPPARTQFQSPTSAKNYCIWYKYHCTCYLVGTVLLLSSGT